MAWDLDTHYGELVTTGGYVSTGFIARKVAEVFPSTLTTGDHEFLLISGQQSAKDDQFIRWKLTSKSITVDGR